MKECIQRVIRKNNKESLLNSIKKQARWNQKDAYPSCKEWEKEDNKFFEFAGQEGQLKLYANRLTTDNTSRRGETINELRAAYFLKKGCGASIVQWHPSKGQGEFTISIVGSNIFCEVKSPGWEGEVVRDQGSNSPCLKKPKYIHAETKGIDNSPLIICTVNKAYKKFSNNTPNLLIIIDDFWMDCFTEGLCIDRALYRPKLQPPYVDSKPEGLFVGRNYEKLGGVLFLKFELIIGRGFVWKVHISLNNNAMPNVRIPQKLVDIIESIRKIDNSAVEIYKIDNGWLSAKRFLI